MTDLTAPQPSSGARSATLRLRGDASLSRLAGRGDRQAFAVVYERYHQQLYRYCLSILRDPEDASDALQSTMAGALRAMDERARDVALRPWLFRIAHNEAVSVLRRRRAHEELHEEHAPAAGDVTTDARIRERLSELVSDLAELPSRQRGALVMRELSGLSYDEIAAVLEVSSAAAKQTVYEARRGLHEIDEGRSMECEHARHVISARDGRLVRGRKVRAHLRTCESCCGFKEALEARPAQLAALAPPLETSTAAAMLTSVLGAGGQGGGTGGGVLAGLAGGGAAVPTTGKVLAAIAAVAAASTAAVAGVQSVRGGHEPTASPAAPRLAAAAPAPYLAAPPIVPSARTRRRSAPRRHESAPPSSSSLRRPEPVVPVAPAVASEPARRRSIAPRSGGGPSRSPARSEDRDGADREDDGSGTPSQTVSQPELPRVPASLPGAGTGSPPAADGVTPAVPQGIAAPPTPGEVTVAEPVVEVPEVPEPSAQDEAQPDDEHVEAPDLTPPDKG